ncbi:hypothetical protein HUE87_11280 [Candidatus Sulfurimonas marisnigri]|uniref:TIGR03016 family PEP-CTERM system-associated outer membrane protein n=1 Tax=Candidatus Sulfurimonas marisnigri TaxID=2740405 RepID=A0A7S7LZQ1_9BACT|nr:hypothetical protein [Candidatus Sulfurimonas marisnigri]QOY54443.1 hypothetical protein HUE87_11280 [Candidatus Sulfurimonas marisnigri]
MMKNFCLTFVCLVLICSPVVLAKNHPDKGLSGNIEFNYEDDQSETQDYKNSEETFTQKYKLLYDGNVYHPKILQYKVYGSLDYSDLKQNDSMSNIKNDNSSQSNNYGGDFSFLKSTKVPFSIGYSKFTEPSIEIGVDANSTSIYYLRTIENYNFGGSVDLGKFGLNYYLNESKNKKNSSNTSEKETDAKYGVNLNYKGTGQSFKLGFLNNIRKVDTNNVNSNAIDSEDNVVDFSYSYYPSQSFKLDTSLLYQSTTIDNNVSNLETKVAYGNIVLNWKPNKDILGSIGLDIVNTDYSPYDYNNISNPTEGSNSISTINLNQMFSYNILPGLLVGQNASYFTTQDDIYMNKRAMFNLITTYSKTINLFNQRNIITTSSLVGNVVSNTTERFDENQTSAEEDSLDKTLTLSLRASLRENLPRLRSNGTIVTSYNRVMQSQEDSSDTWRTSVNLETYLGYLTNKFVASYQLKQGTTVVSYGNNSNLSYNRRIGLRSTISASAGYTYDSLITEDVSSDISSANSSLNFQYVGRKLSIQSNARALNNFTAKQVSYGGGASMKYVAGKTIFTLSYDYMYSMTVGSIKDTYTSRGIMRAKLVRNF